MKLYFGGAEIPTYAKMMEEQKIPCVSLSYQGLSSRKFGINLNGMFPAWQEVFLDSGGYTYNKQEDKYEFEEVLEFAAKYMDFVKANISHVSLVSEFDARQLGSDFIQQFRKDFYDLLPPEKFMPIWHEQDGREALEALCSSYQVVGISQNDIHGDTSLAPIFNSLCSRYRVKLHGVGITSKKLLEAVKWSSVSSVSWLTPSMYGDTFIWDRRTLHRYPRDYKDRRKQHRSVFTSNGFDYEKIEADDSRELLRLSLWSWQSYINFLSGVTTEARNENTDTEEKPSELVDTQEEKEGTQVARQRQTQSLPVMGTMWQEEEKDDETTVSIPHLTIRSDSMRICNTCFLSSKCPGYEPDSTCLYNIPIEIRTKDQLRSLHDSLIEMQSQRVLFMKMAEDISGGYADPNLSSEIDRLNRMIKTKVDGDRNTFSATLNISESPAAPSRMERFFGAVVTDKLMQLENPVQADDILEAEIVSDKNDELVSSRPENRNQV